MQKSHTAINKLALVVLSLVVLELILIGNQVETVKAIKKKMYLKKLKKLLPILALVKPKKKIILLPIPIPMMQHNPLQPTGRPGAPRRPYLPFSSYSPSAGPMSFIMMTQPGQVPPETMSMAMMDGNMMDTGPKLEPQDEHLQNLRQKEPVMSMVVPSMTMTIQSEGGGHSAIELSTNLMGDSHVKKPNDSVSQPPVGQWSQAIQQQKQEFGALKVHPTRMSYQPRNTYTDNIGPSYNGVGGGEPYYSSPWVTARAPLASPMKLLRKDRLRDQPARSKTSTTSSPNLHSYNQRFQPQEHIEIEELIPMGPPQLRPFIQDSSGHLHMQTGNLMSNSFPDNWRHASAEVEETDEVQTVASEPPVRSRSPLKSSQSRQVKGSLMQQQSKNLQRPDLKPPASNP